MTRINIHIPGKLVVLQEYYRNLAALSSGLELPLLKIIDTLISQSHQPAIIWWERLKWEMKWLEKLSKKYLKAEIHFPEHFEDSLSSDSIAEIFEKTNSLISYCQADVIDFSIEQERHNISIPKSYHNFIVDVAKRFHKLLPSGFNNTFSNKQIQHWLPLQKISKKQIYLHDLDLLLKLTDDILENFVFWEFSKLHDFLVEEISQYWDKVFKSKKLYDILEFTNFVGKYRNKKYSLPRKYILPISKSELSLKSDIESLILEEWCANLKRIFLFAIELSLLSEYTLKKESKKGGNVPSSLRVMLDFIHS